MTASIGWPNITKIRLYPSSVRVAVMIHDHAETSCAATFHAHRHMAMGTDLINTRSQPERDGAPAIQRSA